MKVLMIGNTASTGHNLTKGLRKLGIDVVFVGNNQKITSGEYDYNLSCKDFFQKKYGKNHFDIIHIHSPNIKKLGLVCRYLKNAKLICHWHGSELRFPIKTFSVSHLFKKIGDYNLYSTIDLAFWLRDIDIRKKQLFRCPIDTDLFKPYNVNKKGTLVLSDGGKGKNIIFHCDMPFYMNNYVSLKVIPYYGLSEKLLQVSMLEGASCGLNVLNHSWLNRKWVKKNASVSTQANILLEIYGKVLNEK